MKIILSKDGCKLTIETENKEDRNILIKYIQSCVEELNS